MASPTPPPAPPGQPGRHPRPDLPRATWDAIAAAVQECLAASPGASPGFVAIARACRAARKAGRIPGCSNQQLAAALAYLADAGQLGTADTSPAPAPATAPAGGPLRVHINRFLDVVYDEQAGRARVLVGGKPFLHCSFVVASIPAGSDKDIDSIDDLATSLAHDARVLEGPDVRRYLTPAEEVLAHASNLQAWAEHDYDTRLLHSNIAFQLLKELARAGDEVAAHVIESEIDIRFNTGTPLTRYYMARNFWYLLSPQHWIKISEDDHWEELYYDFFIHPDLAFTENVPELPPQILEKLAHSEDEEIRASIYSFHSLTPEIIDLLVNDPSPRVRASIAHHSLVSADVVKKWADDPDPKIRAAIASRDDLPKEILMHLSEDDNQLVRWHVTNSRSLPVELMYKFVNSEDVKDRMLMCHRRDLPKELLMKLINDKEEGVLSNLLFRTDIPEDIKKDIEERIRKTKRSNTRVITRTSSD
nr:hypothetical protein [Candidatus Sigynarchaeum springense]